MTRPFPTLLVLAILPGSAPAASPVEMLRAAADVLSDLASASGTGMPPAALGGAHAVAVFPRVITAGLVVGGRSGHGVLLTHERDGRWGDPVFVDLGGPSIGFQAGVEAADVVLIFRTPKSLDRLLAGKDKATLGASAGGPGGRHAATDGRYGAEILTYSRGRGLYAGVSLDGVMIRPNADVSFARDARSDSRGLVDALQSRLARMSSPGEPPALPVPGVQPPARSSFTPTVGGIDLPLAMIPDRIGVALSALAAAGIGLAYRFARQKAGKRFGAATH